MKTTIHFLSLIGIIIISMSCRKNTKVDPLFTNSIVSTNIDFITVDDSSVFTSLAYVGQSEKEMPDKRTEEIIDANAFVFNASFADGNTVEIWCHSDFGNELDAGIYAQMVTAPLGKLPEIMRKDIDHVVIHLGDETAFGEGEGHFFVLYSDNMDFRLSEHDLEETVFHESVHASFEINHVETSSWKKAQRKDKGYITDYALNNYKTEDMAESAIFAYTMIVHPGRLPIEVEDWIKQNMTNRLEFFRTIFE